MEKNIKVDCFLPFIEDANLEAVIADAQSCVKVNSVTVFFSRSIEQKSTSLINIDTILVDDIFSTANMKLMAEHTNSEYLLFCFNKGKNPLVAMLLSDCLQLQYLPMLLWYIAIVSQWKITNL